MRKRIQRRGGALLRAAAWLVAAFALAALGACSRPGQQSAAVLRVGWGVEADSLSPFISYTQAGAEIFSLIYDPLVSFDENLEPTAHLADGWELSADGLTWTFHLREDVFWHDGAPFTSEDVRFSYELMMKSGLGLYADFLKGISSIDCPDAATVVIGTEKPKANMLLVAAPILPKHIWQEVPFDALGTWENASPVGTGPFRFAERRAGEYLKLAANPSYFKGAPAIQELVFVLFANNDVMAQALKTGELQAAVNINVNQFQALSKQTGIQVISASANGFTELSINCMERPESRGNPILLDTRVRRAMELAIDKQKIIDIAYAGQGTLGTTLVPPDGFWHYEPESGALKGYDPEKAATLLEAAGYRDGDGDGVRSDGAGSPLSFRLLLRSDGTEEVKAGQMIRSMLKAVGILAEIEIVDDGVLMDRIHSYDFDLFIWGWGADVDPTTILSVMGTEQVGNLSDCNYSNPEYDRLLERQATLMDRQERREAVWEMQRILYRDTPYIILSYDRSVQAVRTDRWQGWRQIPEGGPYVFNLTTYNYLNLSPAAEAQGQ